MNGSYVTYRESLKLSTAKKSTMSFDINNMTNITTKPDYLLQMRGEPMEIVNAPLFHPSKLTKIDFDSIYNAKYNSKTYDLMKNDDTELKKYDSLELSGIN